MRSVAAEVRSLKSKNCYHASEEGETVVRVWFWLAFGFVGFFHKIILICINMIFASNLELV